MPFYADILPLVALGGVWATSPRVLGTMSVDSVLSLGTNEYQLAQKPPGNHLFLRLDDSPADQDVQRLKEILPQCLDFIRSETQAGRRVLVHCGAGISRSAAVVIAYVMQEKGLDYPQALQYVRDRKDDVAPNRGFAQLLLQSGSGSF